jgi:D-3-phosphoglycerate dehydrogenase / 2-oxoglutarate reductase
MTLAEGSSVDGIEVEFLGRIAERDTRLLTISVLDGVLAGHTEEEVNLVNAPALAEERGIRVAETRQPVARDFTDLIRVTVVAGEERLRVVGTCLGRRNRPHLLEVWGERFNVQLDPYISFFRYSDVPGMIGRMGSIFGEHDVNIIAANVGRAPDQEQTRGRIATMAVTTDAPVPREVVNEIVASDGFVDGRTVAL